MKKRYTIRGACAALVSGAMVLGVSAVANAVEQDRNTVSATIAWMVMRSVLLRKSS